MYHRFLKICVLLLSLSFTVLPLRMAFAASAMDMPASTGAAHCLDMSADEHAGSAVLSAASDDSCRGCEQCDASCASGCSIVGAMIPSVSAHFNDAAPSAYERMRTTYITHSTTPPSPPPLS
jgi:hypothetical protein